MTGLVILDVLIFGVILSSMYMLISVPFTLIFSVGGIIDLSLPSLVVIACYLYLAMVDVVARTLALVFVILSLIALTIVLYNLVLRHLLKDPMILSLVTLAISIIVQQISLSVYGSSDRTLFAPVEGSASIFGVNVTLNMLFTIAISFACIAGLTFFVKRTHTGKALVALSSNRKGALLVGINPHMILTVTYALAAIFIGIGGISYGGFAAVNPVMWGHILVIILATTLVGGLGSIRGVAFASFVIGFADILTTFLWDPKAQGIPAVVAIIIILCLRPVGLFGKKV